MQIRARCWASVTVALLTRVWAPADGNRLFVVQGKFSPQVSLSSSVLLQLHLHEDVGILPVWCRWSLQGSEVPPAPECRQSCPSTAVCEGWVKILIPQLMAPISLEQPGLCYCLRPVLMCRQHFCKLFLKFVFHLLKNSHINYLVLCRVILIRRNWSTFPIVKIFSTVQY